MQKYIYWYAFATSSNINTLQRCLLFIATALIDLSSQKQIKMCVLKSILTQQLHGETLDFTGTIKNCVPRRGSSKG